MSRRELYVYYRVGAADSAAVALQGINAVARLTDCIFRARLQKVELFLQ